MSETTRPRQALIRLRNERGYSLEHQAAQIGIAKNTLHAAETGEPIRHSTRRKIAEFYERPIAELFPDLVEQPC